ncbi:hypothetical protein F3K32_42340 [Streptomyces sp. LBUM 1483]|uniref:hypothetical protein n=1 Tax=Streptomyces scabiei TaxID=1930 RepID=UPI001B324BFD|nr:hypothetical protein [Streptomyces sp. LBUM 1483]MBP5926653.1 hypothetical protein [Streptomyces sp. LBUM 1483]
MAEAVTGAGDPVLGDVGVEAEDLFGVLAHDLVGVVAADPAEHQGHLDGYAGSGRPGLGRSLTGWLLP